METSVHVSDYLLAGASGQIGRYLLPELKKLGSVELYKRGMALEDIPLASHVINCAGYTKLWKGSVERYWEDNVMLSIKLARHAYNNNAQYHQLSSLAVAEFRNDRADVKYPMDETETALPDVRQLQYSTSKALVELAVRAVCPKCQIIRVSDVVTPLEDLTREFRRTHWLSIIFSGGWGAFDFNQHDYGVWLADAAEMARAIAILIHQPDPCYHAFGHVYLWSELREGLEIAEPRNLALAKEMSTIVKYGPEAGEVTDVMTQKVLRQAGFTWSRKTLEYWQAVAKRSLKKTPWI